ncbi:MAG TPA: Na+/H+ antiporter subunit E [Acetobacteraceae bacterium]|nr:Na+/H+ antiporter subunit E [Acetobacteraceae bacterium]
MFLAFWLILAGVKTADLPAAAAAVAAAVWASLRLMPPGVLRLSPVGIARVAGRFPMEALVAGIDVARRALAPRLPLRPGFVSCPSLQPLGPAREAFLMFASLLPGTVPCHASGDRNVLVHGVDITQPIAEQMAREEARFMQAIRGVARDG